MTPGLQMVFQTRYSFLGASGWQSQTSKSRDLLFDPARLERRLELFEKVALASLRDQTDPDFKLLLLTSKFLPKAHLKRVTEACHDMLGAERAFITVRRPQSAGAVMRRCMRNHLNTVTHSAQIVLDDDDAVSCDFVARCRQEAEFALTQFGPQQPCTYLSFSTGLTGLFEEDGGLSLIPRDMPFTNLGLTLVAPTMTSKNPYMLAHKKVARRHAVRVIHERRPFYIRAVHDTNDSRTHHGDTPCDAETTARMIDWFPLLKDLDLTALRDNQVARAA